MLIDSREEARQLFISVWGKMNTGQLLEPLESMVAGVIEAHPEYHDTLADPNALIIEYSVQHGQTNPFLHMGLHVSIYEQVQTDRPPGVTSVYQGLVARLGREHDAEHRMIDCLARVLWEAQGTGTFPDEQAYLDCLRRL